jgi:hypothetical protein
MLLRSRFGTFRSLTVLGMACLALGNLTHYFWRPAGDFQHGLADGVFGAFLGMGIALLLLALRKRAMANDAR